MNSIILIDGVECAPNSRLQYGFSHEEWDRMLKECKDLYPVENLELDVKSTIFKFAEVGIIMAFGVYIFDSKLMKKQ